MTWAGIIRDFVTFQGGLEKRLALTTSHWSLKAQLVASGAFALLCTGVLDVVVIWGEDFLLCYALNDCDSVWGFGVIDIVYIAFSILSIIFLLCVIARVYRSSFELIVEKFYLAGIIMLWLGLVFFVLLALEVCVSLGLKLF